MLSNSLGAFLCAARRIFFVTACGTRSAASLLREFRQLAPGTFCWCCISSFQGVTSMTARLREISDLIIRLRELLNELEPAESGTLDLESEREGDDKDFGCVLKSLPSRLVIPAAETARRV